MPTSHSLRTWLLNSPSILGSTTVLLNWSMPTDSSDHLSHLQMLPSFLTGSRTYLFGCESIRETLTMFPAMSLLMARTVTIAMTVLMTMIGLTLQDKLEKGWFFQKTFLLADTSLILGMPFFSFNSALAEGELVWRTYTAADTLLVKDSVRKRFASWVMSGPDMLRWYSGIYRTFTNDSSKSLAG